MNGPHLIGLDVAEVVQWLAQHVEEAAEGGLAHGHDNGLACILYFLAPGEAFGGPQRQAAGPAIADVLLHLEGQTRPVGELGAQGVEQRRHLIRGEGHVNNGANDLYDVALAHE